jgi:asparagine synthase (glutamine-hydrolysing)
LDSTSDYLRYGFYLPGTTAFAEVREVLPGHWLRWSADGGTQVGSFWRLGAGGFPGTRVHAQELVRERLRAAVERRLVADVEVGSFLSGGVDSSLVVGLTTQLRPDPPKTFTIGFKDESFDERPFARSVAVRFGTDHYEEELDWEEDRLRDLILHHVGQPFADASILATAMVSQLAGRHVKVALSGDGGDELFSGYQRYLGRTLLRWYTRLPPPLRKVAERGLGSLPEPMAHHSRSLLKKARLFLDLVRRSDQETPYVAPLMYDGDTFQALCPDICGRGHAPPKLLGASVPENILGMMLSDALVYLPQDILLKVDRASMAHSLEVRAPFLDTGVVELAFSLPLHWHRPFLSGKHMLKEGFKDLLPRSVWRRRKQGFAVPVHQWFRGKLGHELEVLLRSVQSPLDRGVVAGMLDSHRQGVRDHGLRLWQIFVYLFWNAHHRDVSWR